MRMHTNRIQNKTLRLSLILLFAVSFLLTIAGAGIASTDEPPSEIYLPLLLSKADRSVRASNVFGYQVRDNRYSDQLVFKWIEIEETGTEVGGSTWGWVIGKPLKFYFPFYDYEYNHVMITDRGSLVFGAIASSEIEIQAIQRRGWGSGYEPGLTRTYYQFFDAPKRLVVEYKNFKLPETEGLTDFEIIVYETGDIIIQYLTVGEINPSRAEARIKLDYHTDPSSDQLVYPDIPRSGDVVQFKFPDEPNHDYQTGERQWFSYTLPHISRYDNYTEILIDPQEETIKTIFMNTDDGYFVESFDVGETWARRSAGGMKKILAPDFHNSGVIFAANINRYSFRPELYRSHNRGNTFSVVHGPLRSMYDVAYSPTYDEDQTLVATGNEGVWFSTDEGLSWQLRGTSTTPERASDIQFSPHFDTNGMLWVRASQELYRGNDAGWHWSKLDTPDDVADVKIAGVEENIALFIVTAKSSDKWPLWRSTDNGDSWKSMDNLPGCTDTIYPSINYAEDHTLYAHAVNCSTSAPLYRSLDGGNSWHEFHQGMEYDRSASVDAITTHPGTKEMFAVTDDHDHQKLYRRAPTEEEWHVVSESAPPGAAIVQAGIAQKDDGELTIFIEAHRSEDSGRNWSELTGLPEGRELAAVELSPNFEQDGIALALYENYDSPSDPHLMHLLRTTDGGVTWNQVLDDAYTDLDNGDRPIGLSPTFQHDQTGFLASKNGVWRTKDGGVTWQQVFEASYLSSIAISPAFASDQTVFAGGSRVGNVYRSTNGGETWEVLRGRAYILRISPSFADDQMLLCCSLERSLDAGDTWEEIDTPIYSTKGIVLSERYQGKQSVAITDGSGDEMWQTEDDGSSWLNVGKMRFGGSILNYFYSSQNDKLYELNGSGLQWRQMNWR